MSTNRVLANLDPDALAVPGSPQRPHRGVTYAVLVTADDDLELCLPTHRSLTCEAVYGGHTHWTPAETDTLEITLEAPSDWYPRTDTVDYEIAVYVP